MRGSTCCPWAAARTRLGLTPTTTAVLYAGHLRALKCVDHLIDAFDKLLADGVEAHLYIVGGSRSDLEDRSDQLKAQAHALALDASITFTGPIEDVITYLFAADVFVLPSEREGISNSIIEALACGVARIAPGNAGGNDVLDRHSGIIPPSNSAADLHRALQQMCDPVQRERFQSGAIHAARRFDVSTVVDQYVWLYQDVRARRIG